MITREIRLSTTGGTEANLDLEGGQSTAFLDVQDSHATGFRLSFGQGSVNSGNTDGWAFAFVPALPLAGVAVIVIAIVWVARSVLRGELGDRRLRSS